MKREEKSEPQPIEMEENRWYSLPAVQPGIPSWAAFDAEEAPEYMVKDEEETTPVREWTAPVEEQIENAMEESRQQLWHSMREHVQSVTNDFVSESTSQYEASMRDGIVLSRNVFDVVESSARRAWNFLTQPVWVPGRHSQPKQYGRGVLFLLDIVRFGGTFASLFVVLFVSLNFQSFWTIAQSYVDPLQQVTDGKLLSHSLNQDLADKLKKIPSLPTAGGGDGNLMAYLPPVGPPENRLIIPKMNLNVPIVDPPSTNLISENWKGLEDDIQKGLQDGVVHYPGTARPGQAGNFFVTGHSSYFPWDPGKFKSVFARLDDLNVGDEYWIYYGGDKYRYVVTAKKVIDPSNVSVLDQPVNERVSTLMTCTPVGTALHRLVIQAQEVDPVTGQPMKVGEHQQENLPQMKMSSLPI